ncbi:hypothetical protein EDD86DRAFT_203940 [Gorgonomyces haynaldii]|nr:hypothetical protein EDD86DRAFT_203940 [Gorgonomyces haynaldii]
MRIISVLFFIGRLVSLVTSLTLYRDGQMNGVCSTIFDLQHLIIEKSILMLYDLVNLVILVIVVVHSRRQESFSAIVKSFLLKALGLMIEWIHVCLVIDHAQWIHHGSCYLT